MFARTDRLLLRPAWREDAPDLFHAIADEGVIRHLARAPWPYRPEDAEAFCAREQRADRPELLLFARTRGSPRLIGGVAIMDGEDGTPELGYWITRPCWGLGFATEAARAMLAIADHGLKLPRLVAVHGADNPASGNVLRKLGFTPTGAIPGKGVSYARSNVMAEEARPLAA
jgi:RimJ/RimL family protein N-acetyltransferase